MKHLNEFCAEHGASPRKTIEHIVDEWGPLAELVQRLKVAGDAEYLYRLYEDKYKVSDLSILDLVAVFRDMNLVTEDDYERTVVLLDYCYEHKVIDLDCSGYIAWKQ